MVLWSIGITGVIKVTVSIPMSTRVLIQAEEKIRLDKEVSTHRSTRVLHRGTWVLHRGTWVLIYKKNCFYSCRNYKNNFFLCDGG